MSYTHLGGKKVKNLVIFKSLQHNRTKLKVYNLAGKMSVGDLE